VIRIQPPPGAICTQNGLTITCQFGGITPGGSITIILTCHPPGVGTFPGATYSVSCGCTDLVPDNNGGVGGQGLEIIRVCLPVNAILFTSDRDGDNDIWAMDSSGGNLVDVTNNPPVDDVTAGWAPDHRKFAYSGGEAGGEHLIRIVELDASNCILRDYPIPNQPAASNLQPRWSPDSTAIAFHSGASGNTDVWVIKADGTGLRRLTSSPYTDSTPTWSYDGPWIAFQSDRPDGTGSTDFDIWITRADGSGSTRQLTTSPRNDFGPAFAYAPSNRLVWHSFVDDGQGGGSFELFTAAVNLTTPALSDVRQITSFSDFANGLGWFSPDNSAIVFHSGPSSDQLDIWVWNGSTFVNLTHNPANDSYPSW